MPIAQKAWSASDGTLNVGERTDPAQGQSDHRKQGKCAPPSLNLEAANRRNDLEPGSVLGVRAR
jgi:hypothetical protein